MAAAFAASSLFLVGYLTRFALTGVHRRLRRASDQRQQHARAFERHLHLTGEQVVDRRAAASVRDMYDIDRSR